MKVDVKFTPQAAGIYKARLVSAHKTESKFSTQSYAFTFEFPYRRMNEKRFVTGNKLAPLDHSVNEKPMPEPFNTVDHFVNIGKSTERFYRFMVDLAWPEISENGFSFDIDAKGNIDLSPLGDERWYEIELDFNESDKLRVISIKPYALPKNDKATRKADAK